MYKYYPHTEIRMKGMHSISNKIYLQVKGVTCTF